MDPSGIPFTLVNFIPSITYFVYAFWPSCPCIDDPEAPSSILSWIVGLVESFRGASAKSLDTTGLSPLLRLQDLSLLAAAYSITPSAPGDRLWSLIYSFSITYIYFDKRDIYWLISRAAIIKCLDTWLKRIGSVSRQGCCFVFCALFILYIYLSSFLIFSHLITVDLQKEKELVTFENFCCRHLCWPCCFCYHSFLRPSSLKEPSTW